MIRGATVVKDGKITWPPPPVSVSVAPGAKKPEPPRPVTVAKTKAGN